MSKEVFDILMAQWTGGDSLIEVQEALQDVPMIPVMSSNLAAVGYIKNKLELTIAFLDGSIYRYYGVPEEEYLDLMGAFDSHGEYFVDNIRLIYPYERIVG